MVGSEYLFDLFGEDEETRRENGLEGKSESDTHHLLFDDVVLMFRRCTARSLHVNRVLLWSRHLLYVQRFSSVTLQLTERKSCM